MTREEAGNIIPILKAYGEGKCVMQRAKGRKKWRLMKPYEEIVLFSDIWEYRLPTAQLRKTYAGRKRCETCKEYKDCKHGRQYLLDVCLNWESKDKKAGRETSGWRSTHTTLYGVKEE